MIAIASHMAISGAALSLFYAAGAAIANEVDQGFASRFFLSGMLLRSSIVCNERTDEAALKNRIGLAMRLQSSDEMKEFARSFTKKSAEWQQQGAETFNQGVVSEGVASACAYAQTVEDEIIAGVDFYADDEVPLQKSGGVYEVPVKLNNVITLSFIVDSGAADVSVPADVVSTLFRAGTIRASDFLGEQEYQLADGTTVPSQVFVLRSMQVGSTIVRDVKASVAKVEGPLLLGQSFLGKFRKLSFDYEREMLIIQKAH